MRDEQVRRYARHILLPDVGGLGQTALLAATARIALDEPAARVAATYLTAGGVGTIIARAAEVDLAHGPDTRIVHADTRDVALPPTPAWWPASAGDATALAYWRGGLAATHWMAAVIARR